jgi:hypothetical protein
MALIAGVCAINLTFACARCSEDLLSLVRRVTTDSLRGYGSWQERRLAAADSTSQALLRAAGTEVGAIAGPNDITCPATATSSAPSFLATAALIPTTDREGWILRFSLRCVAPKGPRFGAFEEYASWEIRKVEGKWRIVRQLSHAIT